MLSGLIARFFRSQRPAAVEPDRVAVRAEGDLPAALPAGKVACVFQGDVLVGVHRDAPPKALARGQTCWLLPRDDVPVEVALELGGKTVGARAMVRFEPDALAELLAVRTVLFADDLVALVASELGDLVDLLGHTTADALLAADDEGRELLRARLSLLLQARGFRCTALEKLRIVGAAGETKPAQRPEIAPRRSQRGQRCPMDAAALVFPDARRVLLLARARAVFGRQRVDDRGQPASDVVLRLRPLGQQQKFLSGLISRRHFSLELRPEGLLASDLGSKLGTYLDDRPLSAPRLLQHSGLQERHVLDAGGILGLELILHRDAGWTLWAECPELADGQYGRAAQASPSPAWQTARTTGIDSVRIRRLRHLPLRRYLAGLRRTLADALAEWQTLADIADAADLVDDLGGREEYLLVFRSATLGSAETDAVELPAADAAESQARVLHLGRAFWLEHLREDAATQVDGQPLGAHELLPLAPGMELQLGEARVRFERFGQIES